MIKLYEEFHSLNESIDVTSIDIDTIFPDHKDIDRSTGLSFRGSTFHGNGAPWQSEVSKMSKLIKDPIKLIKRAKAVVSEWGIEDYDDIPGNKKENAWVPFQNALKAMGFNDEQINKISSYKHK